MTNDHAVGDANRVCPICGEREKSAGFNVGLGEVCGICYDSYTVRRIVGFILDFFVALFGTTLVMLVVEGLGGSRMAEGWYWLIVGSLLSVRDVIGGASLGKRGMGLRVRQQSSGEATALWRLVLLHLGSVLFVIISLGQMYASGGSGGFRVEDVLIFLFIYGGLKCAVCYCGIRLWGEAVSGTRVTWWRFRAKFLPGKCEGCSYDLRGNASGTCPECGLGVSEKNLVWLREMEEGNDEGN